MMSLGTVSRMTGQGATLGPASPARPTAPGAPLQQLPIVKQIRKTVSFIELSCQNGNQIVTDKGTGFYIWYPDERLGKDSGFTYLVTNRHVAECWDESRQPMPVHSITVRLNLNDGSSVNAPVNSQGNAPWVLPSDESVDLAVLPLLPDHSKADYLAIPIADFATDELVRNENINEGSKIIVTGFFYQFAGERRMQPIVREGILAMMPDEDLETTTGNQGRVYLGDVHIFRDNSGTPVCVASGLHLTSIRSGGV